MDNVYPTRLIRKLTKASDNQLKYWIKIRIVHPIKKGKMFYYSFRDIIKVRLIISLKDSGLSLQKIKEGIDNLIAILPESEDPLSRLIIHTDGVDMFVNEKGKYFSAITMQQYFKFDTEEITNELIKLQKEEKLIRSQKIAKY